MRVAGRTVWGAEPEELSLLHVAFYLRSAGSFEMLTDAEGGAQQDRLVGGSQLIAIRVAEELGDRVVLGRAGDADRPSGRRARDRGRATASSERGGRSSRCRRRCAPRIEFDPPLPPARAQLAQRMPMGLAGQGDRRLRRALLARATASPARRSTRRAR